MSEEPKFTPGPWKAHRMRVYLPDRQNPLNVSFTEHTVDNARANAALISAAPEMYDWQGEALAMLRHVYSTVALPIETVHETYQLIERGEAIQKKARGEK